ncbi:MAG: MFS transporter [Gaiellales bacterium]
MTHGYRDIVAIPRARGLLLALVAAWLAFGMVGLGLFLAASETTGSNAAAGLVVATFSAGAGLVAPLRGRLIDRRGARAWLPVFGTCHALGLTAFAITVALEGDAWLLALTAGVAGASAPPIVASTRASWAAVVGPKLLRRAYALTAVVGDVLFVAGPPLAALLFAVAPWVPPVVVAALGLLAVTLVAGVAPRVTREGGPKPDRTLLRRLEAVLAVEVALGVALGAMEVAVPIAAREWDALGASGLLLGAFALGSAIGGVWFGRRAWVMGPERRFLVSALILAPVFTLPALAGGPVSLAALLLFAGLCYGPATISLFEALDVLAPTRAVESLTWVTTAGAIGAATGSAATGWAATHHGLALPFGVSAALIAGAAAYGLRRRS